MTTAKKLLSTQTGGDKLYVDDVFSTYLYTGNGSTQTINNGIDLAGEGGLVWVKSRNQAAAGNIYDTERGVTKRVQPSSSAAEILDTGGFHLSLFNSNGFTIGSDENSNYLTTSTGVSWTFRKAPKFFDVVTYTGDGSGSRSINHNLGIAPGMLIVKKTSSTSNWYVACRLSNGTQLATGLSLNATNAAIYPAFGMSALSSSTTFSVNNGGIVDHNNEYLDLNTNGHTYVAYLFAHDPEEDGIIQCGSFTTDGSGGAMVNLGWEPQYILVKNTTGAPDNWHIIDTMRGFVLGGGANESNDARLIANTSAAEDSAAQLGHPTSTGFFFTVGASSTSYIYMAIRRPNKPPESGDEVFAVDTSGGTLPNPPRFTSGFITDASLWNFKSGGGHFLSSRLTGHHYLITNETSSETTNDLNYKWDYMNGFYNGNFVSTDQVAHLFRRAPGFFDVVCYTGTGVARTVNHSLGVVPELMIVKSRSNAFSWCVYHKDTGAENSTAMQSTNAFGPTVAWDNTIPTSTVFSLGLGNSFLDTNYNGATHVAYLFASLPNISKVGSYTGNGTSQTIDCGFSTGARFILIKRTDSTGDWYVWDSVRGIVAANDPHLSLNTIAAEVTTNDSVDPASVGFIVNQNTATNINVNAGKYIFLAIA